MARGESRPEARDRKTFVKRSARYLNLIPRRIGVLGRVKSVRLLRSRARLGIFTCAPPPPVWRQSEVAQIRADVSNLNMKMSTEQEQFDSLQRTLASLNENLAWKRAALELDIKCWELQSNY